MRKEKLEIFLKNSLILWSIICPKKRGKIFISTDSKNYFDDIKLIVNNDKQFDKVIFECMSNLDNMYGISKYQRKAISIKKEIYKIEITHN